MRLRLAALGLCWALAPRALALPRDSVPLLAGPGVEDAEVRARRDTRLRSRALVATSFEQLTEGLPPLVVDAPPEEPCVGEPARNADIQALLEQAWSAASDETDRLLVRAERDLRCLGEPLERSLGARLHLLRAARALRAGDEALAEQALLDMLHLNPEASWDPRLSPEPPQALSFARARLASEGPGSVRIFPAPTAGAPLWVDGGPAVPVEGQLSLSPGEHIVQVLGDHTQTCVVRVSSGDALLLVIPDAVRADAIDELDEPNTRRALSALLKRRFPGQSAVAVGSTDLWMWDGRGLWSQVEDDGPALGRIALVSAGSAALAASAVVFTDDVLTLARHDRCTDDEPRSLCPSGSETAGLSAEELAERREQLTRRGLISASTTALGALSLTTGLVLTEGGTLTLRAQPGEAWLVWRRDLGRPPEARAAAPAP